jgi:hypothetical protein
VKYANKVKPDYANAGGTEEWSDTEHDWSEVYEEE